LAMMNAYLDLAAEWTKQAASPQLGRVDLP
jgi:hypothetical protein